MDSALPEEMTAEPFSDSIPWTGLGTGFPFVSVVVPCRNEEKHLARCLESILANDYPRDLLDIVVVDGMSEDRTRAIVARYAESHGCVRLVDNVKKSVPEAFNLGIRNAFGDTVMLMSAHSTCETDYIRLCVMHQQESGAENVGGVCNILPGADTVMAMAIVLVLGHPFGSGNAKVKVGADRPVWSDSAAFGCFKKKLFDHIGMFDNRLKGSSDMDMNIRIRSAGGRILLVPRIVVNYYADPTPNKFWKHNFADGVWSTYVMKFRSKAWAWRHWVPMLFLLTLLTTAVLGFLFPIFWAVLGLVAASYLLANVASSIQIAAHEKNPRLLLPLLRAFGIRHLAHGLGALYGALLVLVPGEHWKGRRGASK